MIVLYSNGCPKCNVLKRVLDEKGIGYAMSKDFTKLIEAGFMSAPVLQINEELLNFDQAMVRIMDVKELF